eukprot:FR737961.1.p1 GENE.FR737961.1~~FR737961.1.p1  ORF type:complete len:267 (+),score=2.51 FR737961.1:44-802(+)
MASYTWIVLTTLFAGFCLTSQYPSLFGLWVICSFIGLTLIHLVFGGRLETLLRSKDGSATTESSMIARVRNRSVLALVMGIISLGLFAVLYTKPDGFLGFCGMIFYVLAVSSAELQLNVIVTYLRYGGRKNLVKHHYMAMGTFQLAALGSTSYQTQTCPISTQILPTAAPDLVTTDGWMSSRRASLSWMNPKSAWSSATVPARPDDDSSRTKCQNTQFDDNLLPGQLSSTSRGLPVRPVLVFLSKLWGLGLV